jgi:hypothetical protein
VRGIDDPDVVRFHLGDVARRLRPGSHPLVRNLPATLTPLEGFLLSRVDGQTSARDVLRIVPGAPADLLKGLFGLLCVGLVEFLRPAR